MDIFKLIKKFFYVYFENTIQNIEFTSSLTSQKNIQNLLNNLEKEINFALTANEEELTQHYREIGKILFDEKMLITTIINIAEALKQEINYAINHKIISYDDNEFLSRLEIILQNISYIYFIQTIKKINNSIQKETISTEIDINAIKRWYEKILNSLLNNFDKSLLIYENSECFKWINSLDFKLLTKACTIETKSEIIFINEKIFEITREIIFFLEKKDFKNAFYYLILLDEQINILYNILKNTLITFIENKEDYFFELFSDLILFKKEFIFFLIFTIKSSNKLIHKKDTRKKFFQIFQYLKNKIESMHNDFTGIINDKEMKFIISYSKEFNHEEIFDLITKIIQNYKNQEIILNIPDLIIRAINTESLSGLNADILKKLSYIMTKEIKEKPYYHFKEKESKNLIKKAKKQIQINKKIQLAIENENIELYFQPIIHIQNNKKKLAYCEILSRVNLKNEKIDMQQFIDYIVEENFSDEFDKIVYKKLIKLTPKIAKYLKGVSVNIFPTSLINQEIIKLLNSTLQEFKKYNLFFILEITEYNLFEYYGIIKNIKTNYPNTLKIALDDFGSGYSSFSTLIQLSKDNLLDIIKIDGSITKEILNSEIYFDILKMSVEITNKLNKKVIIEYIENKKIEEKIKTIINDFYAQGFLYSKALPLEEIKNLKF